MRGDLCWNWRDEKNVGNVVGFWLEDTSGYLFVLHLA